MSGAPHMTIRQIASAAGCDTETVRAKIKKLFPDRVKNGVLYLATTEEAKAIFGEILGPLFEKITAQLSDYEFESLISGKSSIIVVPDSVIETGYRLASGEKVEGCEEDLF